MPDIHKSGVRLQCKQSRDGAFGVAGSLGDFAIALKDVPDILTYAGAVVIKLPTDEPKTDDPVIYGKHRRFAICVI